MRRPNSIPHVAQAQPSAVTNWIGVYGLAPPLSTGDRAVGPTLVTAVPVSQQKVARYGDLNSVEPVADPYAEQKPTVGDCGCRRTNRFVTAADDHGTGVVWASDRHYGRGMDYRSLGRTGMQVSPLCLGAMMFGAWGEPDHDVSIKIIHRALDAGINFIDTADVYSQGESEVIVGKALAGRPARRRDPGDEVPRPDGRGDRASPGGDPNKRGNSRRWIIQEVDNSLRRLGTDWIDLYQVHRPDPDTDVEETLSALTDLQRQGKIRAFGSSTFPAHEIVEAQWTARATGAGPVCHRAAAVLDPGPRHRGRRAAGGAALRDGRAAVEPAGRRLADRPLPQGPGRADVASCRSGMPARYDLSNPDNQRKLDAADALAVLADDAGLSLIHLALAFVLRTPR